MPVRDENSALGFSHFVCLIENLGEFVPGIDDPDKSFEFGEVLNYDKEMRKTITML